MSEVSGNSGVVTVTFGGEAVDSILPAEFARDHAMKENATMLAVNAGIDRIFAAAMEARNSAANDTLGR